MPKKDLTVWFKEKHSVYKMFLCIFGTNIYSIIHKEQSHACSVEHQSQLW